MRNVLDGIYNRMDINNSTAGTILKKPEPKIYKLPVFLKTKPIVEPIKRVNVSEPKIYKLPDFLNTNKVKQEESILIDKLVLKQTLDCIALLTTSFEFDSGRLQLFLERTLSTLCKKNIDFIVFLNRDTDISELIEPYKQFFNVIVVSHNIPKKDDVRVYQPNELEYGGCSGPNIQFLKSARYCKKYSTTLFLETDCILQEGWLDACLNYVKYSGTFLISGANYDGLDNLPVKTPAFFHHINGVAFYNTSSPYFEILLDETEMLIKRRAKKNILTQYDVGIVSVVEEKLHEHENYKFWIFIFRHITKNTLIVNYSLNLDKETPISEILFKFPDAVIIHKKD